MYGFRSSILVGLFVASLALHVQPSHAVVAGTGQVTVSVNLLTSRLNITAVFDSATSGLGVNLGPVGSVGATSVTLSNANLATGASFVVPFANASNSFNAVGGVACPSGGCLAPGSGPYAFVGFLSNVNVTSVALPADRVYTFDGSATCTGTNPLSCSGPFVLNAFDVDTVADGASTTVERTVTYGDPLLAQTRQFTARVVLSNVNVGGDVVIAGLSRVRGPIPAPYVTSLGAFRALYFDVASDADFDSGAVCLEIDSDQNGLIDGTNIPATRAAILHLVGGSFVNVALTFPPGFVCADGLLSLSPFVLVVDGTPPATTTTTLVSTTSTSSTTTTTLRPACATARDCLGEVKAGPLCEETINPKLQSFITKKTNTALGKLGKAAGATTPTKAAKFVKQARAAITAIQKKADSFVTRKKGPISSACRDRIRSALAPVLGALDANRP